MTRRRIQADTSINFSQGVTTLSIQHVGLIKELMLRLNATIGYTKGTGGSTQDAQGPFNLLPNINVKVNGIGTMADLSAWLLYCYNLVHYARTNYDPASTENASILQEQTATNVFRFDAVPGATGTVNVKAQLYLPFVVEIADIKEVGLWVAQNDEVNLAITPTWNQAAGSATKLAAPYDIAGGDTFAINTPSLDIVRTFYAVPSNKADYPIIGWFHQLESQRIPMTTTQTEIAHPKGGIILRSIYSIVDGTGPNLMAHSNLSSFQWLYGSNETPYDEKADDVLVRQRRMYGHDLPVGVYTHDFFGLGKQTLRDTFDTGQFQNLRTRINTTATPAGGSYVDVLRERLIPIGNTAEALYSA